MKNRIEQLKKQALEELAKANTPEKTEKIWRHYLGRKAGELTKVLRGLKDLPKRKKKRDWNVSE